MQDLLDLAFDAPDAARHRARTILDTSADPCERSFAQQAMGIVHREAGDVAAAVSSLRAGVRQALRCADPDRVSDVRATLGGTLVMAGRTDAGLRELDNSIRSARGPTAARALMRKAMALNIVGRSEDARRAMIEALAGIDESADPIWYARTLNNLAWVELRLGLVDAAESRLEEAERVFRSRGAVVEVLDVLANRGDVAEARGDYPTALRWYLAAGKESVATGEPPRPELAEVWALTYLAAGLVPEAVALLREALSHPMTAGREVDLRLGLATALLAAGDLEAALKEARAVKARFGRQRRDWGRLRAELVAVRARHAMGDRRDLPRSARSVAAELHDRRDSESPLALIIAGRVAAGSDRLDLWRQAASYRSRANGLVRASAYLARALEREELDDRGGVLRACSAGLDAIDEHRRLMGSSELRALATTHGRELTAIALRHAAHDPRTLLRWTERTRATALAQPPATSDAATIPPSLAALRDNGRRLAEARQLGEPTEELEQERLRLERAVRTEAHTRSAADGDPQRPARVEEIVAGVGDGCLVELVDVDGVLHVLVVHRGRVRRRVAGTSAEVAGLLGPAAMLLRRAARGRPASTADIGRRLQEAILGEAARLLPDGPVVLAPTARLHGLAWSLLPLLYDRPLAVVPSAGQWLRASAAARPRRRRTVLVSGPGLESGGAEVPLLADRHPDAVLLAAADATVPAVLDNLDGADLAHLATHGHFRADSPLFSALDLADGPLTVHDLERLRRAPFRVVLSACESGVLAPVGAEELLGLAAALFSIGTAGLVSSVGEVNDEATAELMIGLHEGLAAGLDPPAALLDVRRAAADDAVAAGTAAAFVALGV